MARILIQYIHSLVTMVEGEKPMSGVDLLIEGGKIADIGKDLRPEPGEDLQVLDGRWRVVYPGFINTHHHLYQTLTRNIPRVHSARLFDWLAALYEVWRELTPEAVEVSTKVGLAELLLSGCTTTADHLYLFPETMKADFIGIEIEAARMMGMRFHPARGSMSRGRSCGGLPPDDVVQKPEEILRDSERLIDRYHDPKPFSMCRIVLAPCSPFSVTAELLEETAKLARAKKVFLHTHLCETKDEEEYCLATCGMRPLDFMEKAGWVGPDVWYAHGIYLSDGEIERLAGTGTGIAHCPGSNLRLGSGICRVPRLLDAGVRVGLAVDGSASNDASSMVREMQLALLVHRVGTGVEAMPPGRVLEMATVGGARLLGRQEIGVLRKGAAADVAMFRLDRIDFAGAMHDPASAILMCGSGVKADCTIVAGRILVKDGRLVHVKEEDLFREAHEVSAKMVEAAERKLGVSYR
jgi:8-oxoguanine deaminase